MAPNLINRTFTTVRPERGVGLRPHVSRETRGLVVSEEFQTREEGRTKPFEYFEWFYNPRHLRSPWGISVPMEYEKRKPGFRKMGGAHDGYDTNATRI